MTGIMSSFSSWLANTHLVEQFQNVDVKGLFHNPYFLIPLILLALYFLYRQNFAYLISTALGLGLWIFSGSDYVRGAMVDGQIVLSKVLPIVGIGIGALAILVYLLFIRSE